MVTCEQLLLTMLVYTIGSVIVNYLTHAFNFVQFMVSF